MNYFICGFMGAGKTHLLAELKNSLKESFCYIDLDEFILDQSEVEFDTLGSLIDELGFDAFRLLELEAIEALALRSNLILSLGGGSLNNRTKAILDRSFKGMYKKEDFQICLERIKNDKNRPLSKLSRAELLDLFERRRHLYESYPSVSSLDDALELIKTKHNLSDNSL